MGQGQPVFVLSYDGDAVEMGWCLIVFGSVFDLSIATESSLLPLNEHEGSPFSILAPGTTQGSIPLLQLTLSSPSHFSVSLLLSSVLAARVAKAWARVVCVCDACGERS